MSFPIDKKLVVAVTSTALFNFNEGPIFRGSTPSEFREHQKKNRHVLPEAGPAYPFIKALLELNNVYEEEPIEVIILSKNFPDAGLRVMDAVKKFELNITRGAFLAGESPYPYMKAFNACLYLSTNKKDVITAINSRCPAGYVLPCKEINEYQDGQLRVAFDFDGVIVDDEAERVCEEGGLKAFHDHEESNSEVPLNKGPLMLLLQKLSKIQKLEREKYEADQNYKQLLRIIIITARNAPAHERLVNTLSEFNVNTDELFFLGGIEKKKVLDILKPHIFFDDQMAHLEPASEKTPSIHIPYGVRNNHDP